MLKRAFTRWPLLPLAVIAVFLAGMSLIHVMIDTIVDQFDRNAFYSARLEEADKLEHEFRDFGDAAVALANGLNGVTPEDVRRSMDLLWVRANTLAKSDYSAAYVDSESSRLAVESLADELPALEAAAAQIVPGEPSSAAELTTLIEKHRAAVRDMSEIATATRRQKAIAALAAQFDTVDRLRTLHIVLGIGGLVGFLFLLFELVRSRRLASKLRHTNETVRELAEMDFLTGLYNRRSLTERLETMNRNSDGRAFSLLCLDLDGFKPINDRLGHLVGDGVLREIAARLKALSNEVFVARLGGDEFAILVPGGEHVAEAVAQETLTSISEHIVTEGCTVSVSGSIGIAVATDGAISTISGLMQDADLALYEAKGRGRNCFCFYQQHMTSDLRRRVQIEEALPLAIEDRTIAIAFQPQLADLDGRVFGLEALSRWQHPALGLLDPVEIFDIAEEIGLGRRLGKYVIDEACAQAMPLVSAMPQLRVAVNVRPCHAEAPQFAGDVMQALRRNGLKADNLVLEFTEDHIASNLQAIGDNLKRLAESSVRIAIDDFGKGYSCYARLTQLPFSIVKLDRSLIANIESDSRVPALVAALVSMTGKLGADIIIEGVESEAQLRLLRAAGATHFQGFLFASPMTPLQMAAWLGRTDDDRPGMPERAEPRIA